MPIIASVAIGAHSKREERKKGKGRAIEEAGVVEMADEEYVLLTFLFDFFLTFLFI
jgi:hypothetical protein